MTNRIDRPASSGRSLSKKWLSLAIAVTGTLGTVLVALAAPQAPRGCVWGPAGVSTNSSSPATA